MYQSEQKLITQHYRQEEVELDLQAQGLVAIVT